MSAKAIKRRHYNAKNEDTREEKQETEPLLLNSSDENEPKGYDPKKNSNFWDDIRRKCNDLAYYIGKFLCQSANNIGNFLTRIGTLLRNFFSFSSQSSEQNNLKVPLNLSPLQEERLRHLKRRLEMPFNSSSLVHQDGLKQLWSLAYPNQEIPPLKSDLWKDMGWQGSDPSTDFRGGGFVSLENLIYFAKTYPVGFQRILHKKDGKRTEWEYPFAVAGINISYMLIQMLDLNSGKMMSRAGAKFVELLEGNEMAFDELYCVTFQMLDSEWLAKRATYMQFNEVLKSTRVRLEKELTMKRISCIQDIPSYRLLNR
ncbi:hypothetical protein LUZ60_015506 [Juncus effusus]|nr:hypothetical protein LUZ60_015506 [Juncus effusus]